MERQSPVSEAPAVPGVDAFRQLLKQYSGAVAWAIERDGIHTRVNLVPSAFTRNTRGPFQLHLVLYSDATPHGEPWVSKKVQFDRDLRVELREVFGAKYPDGFEGYVELVATSPNQDLRPQHYNELWLDYYADDGRVHVVLPTIQFYGSVKRTLGGQNQVWPGLVATSTADPRLITINPYPEEIQFTLNALTPAGERRSSATMMLPAKTERRWRLADVIPDLHAFLAPNRGFGNLLIASTHKMICYFMVVNPATGTISGGDHLAWFYGENL